MLLYFSIILGVTTTSVLIWRTLLLNHPRLLTLVHGIPIVGGALTCGFCSALWFSLIAVLIYNPLDTLIEHPWIIEIWIAWFFLGAGVLFLRNLMVVLIEGGAFLSHLHQKAHIEPQHNPHDNGKT